MNLVEVNNSHEAFMMSDLTNEKADPNRRPYILVGQLIPNEFCSVGYKICTLYVHPELTSLQWFKKWEHIDEIGNKALRSAQERFAAYVSKAFEDYEETLHAPKWPPKYDPKLFTEPPVQDSCVG